MAKRFRNSYIKSVKRTPLHFLRWFLGGYRERGYKKRDFLTYSYPEKPKNKKDGEVTWINHSTFLIEYMGIAILTDPIFSLRASPVQFCGPKRRHPPGIAIEDLKKIDVVIISHNHYDHLDVKTVKTLAKRDPSIVWIIPKGVGKWFKKRGIDNFKELSWGQETDLQVDEQFKLRFCATNAQHHSGRGLFDTNKSLWMGVVTQFIHQDVMKKSLYFVGDSAYNPYEFRKIGKQYKGFNLLLCPIGAYHPRKFMHTVHMSPDEAVKVHCQVKSEQSVGMHFKTFHLSDEGLHEPVYDLFRAMLKRGLDPKTFVAPEPGETFYW